MTYVQTVKGPIRPDELGQTLIHEHITCADWSMRMNFGSRFYEHDKMTEMAVGQLNKAKALGVKTVVDGTPVNLGRDIRLIHEVSQKTGLNIIASSGFYYQEEPWLAMRAEEEIFDLLLHECLYGISGTEIKPGIMKSGVSGAGITPLIGKLLRATGRAAAKTGLPVFCHHDPEIKNGEEILEVYASCGVLAHRIILGHSGDTNDLSYLESVLKTGCYVGFDRLAYCDRVNSLENCVRNILEMCSRGYIGRIFLSHDWAAYLAFWDSWETTKNSDYLNLDADYTFVHKYVIPALKSGGLTDKDIEQIMIENPRRFLAGE
ncbi:MAG: phosphotriesterase family protein [Oscillospiraceae bacterium]